MKVTVDELASSMGKVIPTANAYGVNLDQLCSYLAESTSQGITCAESVTYVNSAFNELGDSGSTVGKILKENTGKTFKELMESGSNLSDIMVILNDAAKEQGIQFSELWGSAEAGKAGLSILTDEGNKFNGVLKDMQGSSGATAKAFETVSDTAKERLNKSINELKNSFLKMGEKLTPLVDSVSKGIEKVAEAIGNMDPAIAESIVKFAALTLGIGATLKVVGTFTSGIGSLVSGVGKGIKALANLITINTETVGALTAAGTATEGLSTSAVAAAGGFGLFGKAAAALTSPVGLAVGAIAGIGLAIYATQKDLEDNQNVINSMGDAYDDFTGRLRDDSTILGEIFGHEYEWKLSDNYKQALADSQAAVETWMETLKGYQQQIYDTLNSTEKTSETKQDEIDQLLGTQHIAEIATTDEINPYADYLKNTYGDGTAYDRYIKAYNDYIVQLKGEINANNDEIKQIITSDMARYGEISQDGLNRIQEIEEENAAKKVDIQKQSGEDITNMLNIHYAQTAEAERSSAENSVKSLTDMIEQKKKANEDWYQKQMEFAKNDTIMNEQEKNAYMQNVDAQMTARQNQEKYMESFYFSLAEMDVDYANQNGLVTNQIVENGKILGTEVENTANGMKVNFFDTQQAMQEWADSHGQNVTQIELADGHMAQVIMDNDGNIIGSVNGLSDRYALFESDINGVMSSYMSAVSSGQMTTDQAMAQIGRDLASGKLSAEQFGMSDQEFYAVAAAMLASGGDADALRDAINRIPKNTNVNVATYVSGLDAVESLRQSVANLPSSKQIEITTHYNVSGTNMSGNSMYATGGTVPFDQIAWTNENHRFELTDRPAFEMGITSFGSLTALSGGTRVYNNTASVAMMKEAVQEEVNRKLASVSLGSYYNANTPAAVNLTNSVNPAIVQTSFDSSNVEKLMANMIDILGGILNKTLQVNLNKKAFARELAPDMNKELGRLK